MKALVLAECEKWWRSTSNVLVSQKRLVVMAYTTPASPIEQRQGWLSTTWKNPSDMNTWERQRTISLLAQMSYENWWSLPVYEALHALPNDSREFLPCPILLQNHAPDFQVPGLNTLPSYLWLCYLQRKIQRVDQFFEDTTAISFHSDHNGNPKPRAPRYLKSVDIWYGGRTRGRSS